MTASSPTRIRHLADRYLLRRAASAPPWRNIAKTLAQVAIFWGVLLWLLPLLIVRLVSAYELDGRRIQGVPSHADDLRRLAPVYETLPGWRVDVTKVKRLADLPEKARAYLHRISELVGRPVEIVSVGPDREQTIFAGEAR